jgi:hypothetical protein
MIPLKKAAAIREKLAYMAIPPANDFLFSTLSWVSFAFFTWRYPQPGPKVILARYIALENNWLNLCAYR